MGQLRIILNKKAMTNVELLANLARAISKGYYDPMWVDEKGSPMPRNDFRMDLVLEELERIIKEESQLTGVDSPPPAN